MHTACFSAHTRCQYWELKYLVYLPLGISPPPGIPTAKIPTLQVYLPPVYSPRRDLGPEIQAPLFVNRMTDRHLWIHYLPTTTIVIGNKVFYSKANRLLANRWGRVPSVHMVERVEGPIGPITWRFPNLWTDTLTEWQTDATENITFPQNTYQAVKMYKSHCSKDVPESELHVLYTMFVTYTSCNCSHYQSPRTVIPSSTTHFVSLICKQKADKLVWAVNLWHKQVLIATVVCRLLTNHSMECLI